MKSIIIATVYFAVMIVLAASVQSCSNYSSQYTKCGTHSAKVKMRNYNAIQYR